MNESTNQKDISGIGCSNPSIHYRFTKYKRKGIVSSSSTPILSNILIPMRTRHLLHVGSVSRLGGHRLALDALSTGVVILRVLADICRAGV